MSQSATHGVRHVRVPADRSGQRLDNFLLGQLEGVPRSVIYRLVRTGQVRVNGGRAKPMKKLAAGDEVRIPPVSMDPAQPRKVPVEWVERLQQRVIELNQHYLIIDKPEGLAMHGGSGLAWGLMDLTAQIDPEWRPVHRLDRPTSGLLMMARSHQALVALQRELVARRVEKRYLALLHGRLAEDRTTVNSPLKKIRDGSGQHRVIAAEDGQSAVTHFRVLERLAGFTYVEAEIETGRTHQIRAHAASLGHPLAGDERYAEQSPPAGLKRLFLHAHFLRLGWPEERLFSSPLPAELAQVLDTLRRPDRAD
ncbi:MAG: RluA family pseudouridine synthase [Wenzhouxiangella sp.]